MTCGIYKITFEGIDGCYIGQSAHLEKRMRDHRSALRDGRHYNYKLSLAYSCIEHDSECRIEVLEECSMAELDNREEHYIRLFDSVKNGFNFLAGTTATARGTEAANSKYTREQILEIVELLLDPVNSNIDISTKLSIPITIVQAIAYGKRHRWVQEEFPEKWTTIQENIKSNSRFLSSNNINKRNDIVHTLISPQGLEHKFHSIAAFAREHNLNKSHVCQVLKGNVLHHKNWKKGGV